jgi:hypothetical protein
MDYLENKNQTEKSVNTEAMISRQSQEVQGMIISAKRFPRDENASIERILKSCERVTLAKEATYEFPRGGQKVTGPSIRLAEAIAQNWGNIDFGINELEQKNGESTVLSYAWDMETNTRNSKTFTVKHERKANGVFHRLIDPRDIYELAANQGARRLRSCILGIIPGDVVDAAVEKCQETLAKHLSKDGKLAEKIKSALETFETKYKVTKEMVEKFIGCKSEAFTALNLVKLSGVLKSLDDGMSKPEDYFEGIKPSAPVTGGTKLDKEFSANSK